MKANDARPVLEAAIHQIAQRQEPEVRLVLGEALRQVGYDLTDLGHHDDALVVYEAVIHWLGQSDDPLLQTLSAQVRVNRADVLATVEGPDAAIAAFDEVAAAYGESAEPELQGAVARALRGKATLLRSLDKTEEAFACDRDVVERFGSSDDEDTLDQVGLALNTATHTALKLLNLPDEGDALFARSIELFSNRAGSPLRAHAINARYNRGVIRSESGDPESALQEWDLAIAISQDESEMDIPEIQGAIARVLVSKGLALREMGQIDEAARQYEIILSYCDRTDDPEVATAVCNAANNLVDQALVFDGDIEACLPLLEAAIDRSLGHDDDETSAAIAHALLTKAFAEWKVDRRAEAITTYDSIIALYRTTPALTAKVAEARYNKALRLQELGRAREALAVLDSLIDEYSASDDPAAQEIAASAEEVRAEIRCEGSSDA